MKNKSKKDIRIVKKSSWDFCRMGDGKILAGEKCYRVTSTSFCHIKCLPKELKKFLT
jgi:hypothetical protein